MIYSCFALWDTLPSLEIYLGYKCIINAFKSWCLISNTTACNVEWIKCQSVTESCFGTISDLLIWCMPLATQLNCKEKRINNTKTTGLFIYHCKLSVACRWLFSKRGKKNITVSRKATNVTLFLLCQYKLSEQRGAPFYQTWTLSKKLGDCSLRKIVFGSADPTPTQHISFSHLHIFFPEESKTK